MSSSMLAPITIIVNFLLLSQREGIGLTLVVYKHSAILKAPIKFVYDWCTDFQESDPQLWGENYRRIILEKSKKRVVYASYKPDGDGKQRLAVSLVLLFPTRYSWHLDYFAEEDLETGEYKLTRLEKELTRLDLVLKNTWKSGPSSTRESFESGTKSVWDQYRLALEKDYAKMKNTL
jgi:hypothetical protein